MLLIHQPVQKRRSRKRRSRRRSTQLKKKHRRSTELKNLKKKKSPEERRKLKWKKSDRSTEETQPPVIENIKAEKLEGPKILGKIELPVDNDTQAQKKMKSENANVFRLRRKNTFAKEDFHKQNHQRPTVTQPQQRQGGRRSRWSDGGGQRPQQPSGWRPRD